MTRYSASSSSVDASGEKGRSKHGGLYFESNGRKILFHHPVSWSLADVDSRGGVACD